MAEIDLVDTSQSPVQYEYSWHDPEEPLHPSPGWRVVPGILLYDYPGGVQGKWMPNGSQILLERVVLQNKEG